MINKKILDRIHQVLKERTDRLDELRYTQTILTAIKRNFEDNETVATTVNLCRITTDLHNIDLPIHMLIEIMENKVNYLEDSIMLLNTELKELGYEVTEYDDKL